ncbi:MAG: biotin/lipoyl-binding protein, partial [Gemmatimonadaceae bacterium]
MTILPPLALRTLPRLTLLAVATAVIATACAHDAGEEDEAPAQPTISARTAVAAAQPFTESLSAIGSVVARAGHAATLGAAGPTRVVRVYVATGQRVRAGQPLVELEATAFEAAAQSADAALQAAPQ